MYRSTAARTLASVSLALIAFVSTPLFAGASRHKPLPCPAGKHHHLPSQVQADHPAFVVSFGGDDTLDGELTIYSDGALKATGGFALTQEPAHTGFDQLNALMTLTDALNFFKIPSVLECDSPAYGGYAAPIFSVSVYTANGKEKSVTVSGGCTPAPYTDQVNELKSMIQAVAGAKYVRP
jgi:hypothetical protein